MFGSQPIKLSVGSELLRLDNETRPLRLAADPGHRVSQQEHMMLRDGAAQLEEMLQQTRRERDDLNRLCHRLMDEKELPGSLATYIGQIVIRLHIAEAEIARLKSEG